jgi:hypothetical protein
MSFRRSDVGRTYRERILSRITVDLQGLRVVDDAPCWQWAGKSGKHGYGYHRDRPAHRAVYELLVASVADGLDLDHLCRNRLCVNPAHLEPVTHAENCRRGIAGEVTRARMLAKTHCAQGHEWTPENTMQTARQRKCRTCMRESSARAREQRRASA